MLSPHSEEICDIAYLEAGTSQRNSNNETRIYSMIYTVSD